MSSDHHYPVKSYRRMYDPAAGPLWSVDQGLSPEEDGDHYRPERDFFEWWYFDAAFENGYHLVVLLHSSLYNAVDHKPTVDLRVTPPQGASAVAIGRYERTSYRAASDHCDVRISGCRAAAIAPNHYRLHLEQGDIVADLEYKSNVPGWKPGTGYLFADEASGHFFKWVVPLPLAEVEGTLCLNSQKMAVRGFGYHDHNWGNFVLADAFSHWYWGRAFSPSGDGWGTVFGDVVSRSPQPAYVNPLLIFVNGQIIEGKPDVILKTHNPVIEPTTGVRYPGRLDLMAFIEDYRVELTLEAGRVIEALDFASPSFRRRVPRQLAETAFYLSLGKPLLGSLMPRLVGKGSYLRLQARASFSVQPLEELCLSGDAIFEVMQFHKPGGQERLR